MKSLEIYWASIEYRYNKTSPQSGKLTGGLVYGFVKAFDAEEALDKFTSELKSMHMDTKWVEFISPYDTNLEWETKEQKQKFLQLYKEAESVNEVLFDDFYAYESEE